MKSFHVWFDGLKEPWRMLLALLIVFVVVIMPINMGGTAFQNLFHLSPLTGLLIALSGLIIGLFLVSSRIHHLESRARVQAIVDKLPDWSGPKK